MTSESQQAVDLSIENMLRWREESLHPDLEPYLSTTTFGPSLRHPLVYHCPLVLPGMANLAYEKKTRVLEQMVLEGDYNGIIWLHERPWRCHALIEYITGYDEMGAPIPLQDCDEKTRDLASHVWTDSENIEQYADQWAYLLAGDGWLMGDREAFDALPDPVEIYRGDIDDGGWSWSTDLSIAQWFARRYGAADDLVYATVPKEHVFAYLTHRGEDEILVRLDAPLNIIKRVPYRTWIKEVS